ncbi:MvdC/MvdD family ATP grasp protein [Streptomyces sp. NPDC050428]|uniref:MvdC/MvdD family ATP grasp protein n=1 Tax=Streptomyces sp. NPDC050428 TaxID=3155757 RepID=UPI0034209B39
MTPQHDLTADRVVMALEKRGAPVLRFDIADAPDAVSLHAELAPSGWTGTVTAHGRTVRLEEIGGVYWWHTQRSRPAGQVTPQSEWASNETTAGLAGVLAALACVHVNHPARTHAAQCKADVLVQAQAAGLMVPPTCISNTPAPAREFAQDLHPATLWKSLRTPAVEGEGLLYTQQIDPDGWRDDALASMVHQFQRGITKAFEVRLVVVGERLFAARIDAHSAAAKVDFRADPRALTYQHVWVPEPVARGVLRLLAHYGLRYAALDLLVDHAGVWWLVDLNAAGQWGWIEQALPDLGISSALAEELAPDLDVPALAGTSGGHRFHAG